MTTATEVGASIVGVADAWAGARKGYEAAKEAQKASAGEVLAATGSAVVAGATAGASLGPSVAIAVGASAGAAAGPIGAAVGAVAGLCVSLGVALSQLLDAEPVYRGRPIFDRFGLKVRPHRLLPSGKWRRAWTLEPNTFERRLAMKPTGRSNLGTILWAMRRLQEDGGGAADLAEVLRRAGFSYQANVRVPSVAEAEQMGRDVVQGFPQLPFVGVLAAQLDESPQALRYMGALRAGLDVPAARQLAGMPPSPLAERYLADARARVARAMPAPAAPVMTFDPARLARVPDALLRALQPTTGGQLTVSPAALRPLPMQALAGVVRDREMRADPVTSWPWLVGAAALVGGGIWYFNRKARS